MSDLVTTNKDTALAEINEIASEFAGVSLVNVRDDIFTVPRLKLAQAMSPAVEGGLTTVGNFFIEKTGDVFGESVEFIPIHISQSASLMNSKEFKRKFPGTNAGAIVCSTKNLLTSNDGCKCSECPYGEYWKDWGTKDSKKVPMCKESIDIIGIVPGQTTPVVISFRKNNKAAGKEIAEKVFYDPKKIPFGSAYTLKSTSKTNEDNQRFYLIAKEGIATRRLTVEEIREILPTVRSVIEKVKSGLISAEEEVSDADDSVTHTTKSDMPSW